MAGDSDRTRSESAGGEQAQGGSAGGVPAGGGEARGRTVTRLTDPRALRAYAHPVRMALVGLLRTEGPLTATRAGELLGESSGTCSFHLRPPGRAGGTGAGTIVVRYEDF